MLRAGAEHLYDLLYDPKDCDISQIGCNIPLNEKCLVKVFVLFANFKI